MQDIQLDRLWHLVKQKNFLRCFVAIACIENGRIVHSLRKDYIEVILECVLLYLKLWQIMTREFAVFSLALQALAMKSMCSNALWCLQSLLKAIL
jgi:hypothetical protein